MNVVIIGLPGTGKSTLGRTLSRVLGIPLFSYDKIKWERHGVPYADAQLRSRINAAVETSDWVFEGCTDEAWSAVFELADTVLWLDYPFYISGGRLLRRQLGHYVRGRRGLEDAIPATELIGWMPGYRALHQMVLRTLTRRSRYEAAFDVLDAWNKVVRLRSPREAEGYVNSLRVEVTSK